MSYNSKLSFRRVIIACLSHPHLKLENEEVGAISCFECIKIRTARATEAQDINSDYFIINIKKALENVEVCGSPRCIPRDEQSSAFGN